MRAVILEVFYDGASEPSISVPCLDFFGVAHGRPLPYASALTSMQEGRGFNSSIPLPFGQSIRIELLNGSSRSILFYYQVDYVLADLEPSYLHVSFRRQNPTERMKDFVIADGIDGPGRFLGCVVGVRVLDGGIWYGEGEVKIFRDGDETHPTICGTGLEDYVGTAWGMGPHHAPYAGAPLDVRPPQARTQPDFVSFYRWHVLDPVMFSRDLRVTIQQIGAVRFREGQEEEFERFAAEHPVAGQGWFRWKGTVAQGLFERVDDYSAAAFVYATTPQPVAPVDVPAAVADLERREYEKPDWMEAFLGDRDDRRLFRPRGS
jgi:hypothetical protein